MVINTDNDIGFICHKSNSKKENFKGIDLMTNNTINTIAKGHINAGMPELESDTNRSVSPYEFLPSWFFYTPVVIQSFFLGLKHFDFTLPLIANPSIKLSGMVGESKHDILNLAGPIAQQWISPFTTITTTNDPILQQTQNAIDEMNQHQLSFPVVAKPDLGCRGVGVKLIQSPKQLSDERLDQIFNDLEGFHYGRLDVKFKDIQSLMKGDDFTILEINGASSEAAHIWDRNTPLKTIFSTLLLQYKILFEIGALQKKQGHHSPKIKELLAAWKEEKQLTLQYPSTD
jgi:hypothetical protein